MPAKEGASKVHCVMNFVCSVFTSIILVSICFFAVFCLQMLINFPMTDINLKSDGGITPLMDAVKITNMYMVKQLVKKNADISLTDYEGKKIAKDSN